MTDDGLKKLTIDNWLERDPIMLAFGRLGPEGRSHPIPKEQLASAFLAIDLSEKVPVEIQTLFATGRGAMLYGFFYYPLYAVGLGELTRTAERALAIRFKELDGPKGSGTFQKRLEWMQENGHFTTNQFEIWEGLRRYRNAASHPEYQMVGPPHEANHQARVIAHAISCLFDSAIEFDSFWTQNRG